MRLASLAFVSSLSRKQNDDSKGESAVELKEEGRKRKTSETRLLPSIASPSSLTSLTLAPPNFLDTTAAEALVRLLHPPPDDDDPGASSAYRVLILDAFTKDVVAPLLRVGDLRRHGVSLHLQLRSARDPIPDAPAVYFVSGGDGEEEGAPSSSSSPAPSPSPSVVDVIAADAARGLYSKMHLNFCGGLAEGGLKRLAAAVVAADASGLASAPAANGAAAAPPAPRAPPSALDRIGRVIDQHLAFVALEPGLFTLRQRRSYVSLHDPGAPPAAVERAVAAAAEGLFSALATLGVVPLIRCPKGGPAQAVAVALDARLREAARRGAATGGGGGGVGGGAAAALAAAASSSSASRPLLVIFDRSVDMAACLQHGWTYKPLVADVLGLELNRVSLPRSGSGESSGGAAASASAAAKTTVEVGPGDFFWEANGSSPFPAVAEEVDAQLKRYKAAVEEVNRNAASGGGPHGGAGAHVAALQGPSPSSTASLATAVASLPELAERKRTLDRHTNIATQLLHAIKARGLDAWHAAEEDVVSGLGGGIGGAAAAGANLGAVVGGGVAAVASRVGVGGGGGASSATSAEEQQRRNETTLEKLLRGEKGSAADRTRAALVWAAAASPPPSDEEFQRVEAALRDGGGDCGAFAYVRRLRRLNLAG